MNAVTYLAFVAPVILLAGCAVVAGGAYLIIRSGHLDEGALRAEAAAKDAKARSERLAEVERSYAEAGLDAAHATGRFEERAALGGVAPFPATRSGTAA